MEKCERYVNLSLRSAHKVFMRSTLDFVPSQN